MHSLAL